MNIKKIMKSEKPEMLKNKTQWERLCKRNWIMILSFTALPHFYGSVNFHLSVQGLRYPHLLYGVTVLHCILICISIVINIWSHKNKNPLKCECLVLFFQGKEEKRIFDFFMLITIIILENSKVTFLYNKTGSCISYWERDSMRNYRRLHE